MWAVINCALKKTKALNFCYKYQLTVIFQLSTQTSKFTIN